MEEGILYRGVDPLIFALCVETRFGYPQAFFEAVRS